MLLNSTLFAYILPSVFHPQLSISNSKSSTFTPLTPLPYINLAQQTYTYSIWQSSGSPCGHAISILLDQKEDSQHYVKLFFTIEAYKKIYEQALLPLDLVNVIEI